MSITNQLSLDVAAIPFLWVVPLALYLITFIVSFGGYYRRVIWRPAFILGLGMMAVLYKLGASASLPLQIAGSTFTLFAGCMICHGELASLAPRSRNLTAFYLTMATGGAAGGLLVALVAPAVFSDLWELPIFLLLPYVLMAIVMMRQAPGTTRPLTWIAIGAILWLGIAAFLLPALRGPDKRIAMARNFYGVLHVLDEPLDSTRDSLHALRHLRHGRITHGTQFLNPKDRGRTTAYYAEGSGVELAIDHHPRRAAGEHLAIGAIGLGVGTIAAYGLPGDTLRFYEINPDVERLARRYFTFLADSKATVEVTLGDGRLSLEREVAGGQALHRFDILVADAFAGDAIPVHLLTVEAMALYWQALKEDGVLAIHVSNRYLNLARVVSGIAPRFHKRIVRIRRGAGAGALGSTWLLVTSNRRFLNYVANNVPFGADIPAEPPVVWTDAFSNLYDVLGEEES
jgi:spermidine synthase